MKILRSSAAALVAVFTVLLMPTAAQAAEIGWFYNSNDHDAKARFRSYGDHIDLCKLNNAKVYVDYSNSGRSSRVYYDGTQDTCTDINENFPEGSIVYIQVCELKTLSPDDCSDYHAGVA